MSGTEKHSTHHSLKNARTLACFGEDSLQRVENALNALRAGQGILLVDDEDRENEGDIIFAAKTMTVADMAQMIRYCSGIVCLCLTEAKCQQLQLPPMVVHNDSKNQTAFTISIEAKEGVTTGVSAQDRIQTIRTAIACDAQPADLAHPGHVFPLTARSQGVLARRGHTEGSVDLVQLAGLGDSAVLCELMNDDGSMARLPQIIDFAFEHEMTVVTIEDICCYRKQAASSRTQSTLCESF